MPSAHRWDDLKAIIEARRRREKWYKPGMWMLRALCRRIGDARRAVRYAYQRVARGYDDRSLWNLNHYLPKFLGEQLVEMAEIAHGFPGDYGPVHSIPDDPADDPRFVQWTTDLRRHGEALLEFHKQDDDLTGNPDEWEAVYAPAQEALRWVAENLATLWD